MGGISNDNRSDEDEIERRPAVRGSSPRVYDDPIAKRIDAVFMVAERRDTPRGARSWFASTVGVSPVTVYRWCAGEQSPHPAALAFLGEIEARLGITSSS